MKHRATWRASALAVLGLVLLVRGHGLEAAPAGTYVWLGEFVAADPSARTVTIKARLNEHVAKSIERFKPGDRVMLVWDMILRIDPATAAKSPPEPPQGSAPAAPGEVQGAAAKKPEPQISLKTESDILIYVESYEVMKGSKIDSGYILPAELVSAESGTLTAKLRLPENMLQALAAFQPGQTIRVTSPMSQPNEIAGITAVSAASPDSGRK